MKKNQNKGISLMVLVITMIVMIIIASAIILSVSSGNTTSRASWARLSSDRASLQSEYAMLLSNMTTEGVDGQVYSGLSIEEVRSNEEFKEWCGKVESTREQFIVYGDDELEVKKPSEIEVRLILTNEEVEEYGLTIENGKVNRYDWIDLKGTTLAGTTWKFNEHISGYDFLEYFNFEEQTGWEDFPEGCVIENEDTSYGISGFTLTDGGEFDVFGTVQGWSMDNTILYIPSNELSEINGWVVIGIEMVSKYLYGEISSVEELIAAMTPTTAPTVKFSEENNEALMSRKLIKWMYQNAKRID